jgi:hypothetical protein
MKFITNTPPDGYRLFRVTLVSSVAAVLIGWLVLLALWASVDYEPDFGWAALRIGGLVGALLALGTVLHYPWSRRHCEALGSKYPE